MLGNEPNHQCRHLSCKCELNDADEFCGVFCEDVESSEDDLKCGCGHMRCDTTKELGNEVTFGATGS